MVTGTKQFICMKMPDWNKTVQNDSKNIFGWCHDLSHSQGAILDPTFQTHELIQ